MLFERLFLNHPLPSQWISPKQKIRTRFFYMQCTDWFENRLSAMNWGLGDPNALGTLGYGGNARGLVVDPSIFGVEFFLYAMGSSHMPVHLFFFPHITFDSIEGVTLPVDCESLNNPTMTPEAHQILGLAREVPSSQNPPP